MRQKQLSDVHRIYGEHFGCAIADITTGDCFLTEVDKCQKLLDEINKFTPAEIICNDAFFMSGMDIEDLKERLGICIFPWIPGILMMNSAAVH